VGIVLVIVGAVLLFVPVYPQSDQTIPTSHDGIGEEQFNISGFSITGSVPVAVSWTSEATVTVYGAVCNFYCGLTHFGSPYLMQNGTSGSFSLNPKSGEGVYLWAVRGNVTNVTFKVTTALTTAGLTLLALGGLVMILGALLKSSRAKSAATGASEVRSTTASAPQPRPPGQAWPSHLAETIELT
jgi:hypothetical protein